MLPGSGPWKEDLHRSLPDTTLRKVDIPIKNTTQYQKGVPSEAVWHFLQAYRAGGSKRPLDVAAALGIQIRSRRFLFVPHR